MVSEGRGREYKSDVPELEAEEINEDKEVVKGREIPLHEELGFESAAQMQQAKAKQAEILKEKDQTKADKLRAELRAMLDDTDGEPVPSNAAIKTGMLEKIAEHGQKFEAKLAAPAVSESEKPTRDTPYERNIGRAEFEHGMLNANLRVQLDTARTLLTEIQNETNVAKADQLRNVLHEHFVKIDKQQKDIENKQYIKDDTWSLTETSAGRAQFDAETQNITNQLAEQLKKSAAELSGDDEEIDETTEKRRRIAKEKAYSEATTEVFGAGEKTDEERKIA